MLLKDSRYPLPTVYAVITKKFQNYSASGYLKLFIKNFPIRIPICSSQNRKPTSFWCKLSFNISSSFIFFFLFNYLFLRWFANDFSKPISCIICLPFFSIPSQPKIYIHIIKEEIMYLNHHTLISCQPLQQIPFRNIFLTQI